ncbi:uncharacterized protein SEPMUDRAFT_145983 [Sphaerulina musiva SO2202]|uniref:Apple domain-containing protein n=1 Tax=Sphaerulina musiva (strain SO2202) TaxID=692275 RepID=N1QKP1_SPHMS|nr:uncharacterized protein SEPMUDRAFT_145983 [Sphaerulina musiva SO2202]EMF16852.1 hypothetical protein SEPMUDRAFT_145983 [Sphaerulina musiva SO2202]
MMIIPSLADVARALKGAFNTTTALSVSSSPLVTQSENLPGRSRAASGGRVSALLQAAFGADWKQSDIQQTDGISEEIEKRQTSVKVGVPFATTRTYESKTTSTIVLTTTQNGIPRTSSSSNVATVTQTVTESATTTNASSSGTTASASLTGTTTANASTPVSTVTAPLATSPPTCPDASLDQFTDSTGISYLIKCSTTNSASAYELIKVTTGGYGQCFASCSFRGDCVGFSFVGTDSGICYLRNVQSSNDDETALVSSYVTCYKVDPSAVATSSSTSTPSKSNNIGAIAGGVVGGVVALVVLLGLIAFFVRRHRKKVDARREERRQIEIVPPRQYYDGFHQNTTGGGGGGGGQHLRSSSSTANGVYEGFSQRPIDLNHTKKSADPFGTGRTAERIYPPRPSYAVEPGARAQDVGAAKAGVLRLPQMLDGTPIGPRSAVPKSGGGGGSRTSMFVENMVELEARVARPQPFPGPGLACSGTWKHQIGSEGCATWACIGLE